MAQNKPTSWPPAPESRETEPPAPPDPPLGKLAYVAGRISLVLSVAFLLGFVMWFWVLFIKMTTFDAAPTVNATWPFLLLWGLCGIVSGFVGWKSSAGRIGITISTIVVILSFIAMILAAISSI